MFVLRKFKFSSPWELSQNFLKKYFFMISCSLWNTKVPRKNLPSFQIACQEYSLIKYHLDQALAEIRKLQNENLRLKMQLAKVKPVIGEQFEDYINFSFFWELSQNFLKKYFFMISCSLWNTKVPRKNLPSFQIACQE